MRAQNAGASRGVVVIGTVHGDLHDIGKTLVATLLSANGFEVHDLGADVPVERFIAAARETKAKMVAASAPRPSRCVRPSSSTAPRTWRAW